MNEIKTYQVKTVGTKKISPPSENPNSMSPETFDTLVNLIQAEGFLQPLLVKETTKGNYEVVDGDHRLAAANKLGMTELPCVILPADYPVSKQKLLQLALNKLRGEMDLAGVAKSLELIVASADIEATLSGFSASEIEDLLKANAPSESLEDLLGAAGTKSAGGRPPAPEVYVLELAFESGQALKEAKKALKKAGGGDMVAGLLELLTKA